MPFALPIADPGGIFFVILALMLLAHFLTDRLKLPALAGLVAAGLIAGPSGLGLVSTGAGMATPEGLAASRTIARFGQVGLAYAFFLLGADMDFTRLKKAQPLHLGYAALLALMPAVAVSLALLLVGLGPVAAIAIGLVFASQSPLPQAMVQKLGLARSRPALAAEGGTEATETFRVAILAILAAILKKPDNPQAWIVAILALALAAFVLGKGLPFLAALFFKRAKPNDMAEFIFVLALAFLCAYLPRHAGLESFVGAFVAGLFLGRFFPERSALEKRIRFAGEWLFLPLFLLSLGMSLDLGTALGPGEPDMLFGAWRALAWGLGLAGLVLGAKFLAALALKPIAGFSKDEALFAFGLTAGQALSAVAAAGVARSVGAIDDTAILAVIVASVLTSLVAPYVARKAGGRLALADASTSSMNLAGPERIVVGISNPSRIDGLLDLAFLFRKRGSAEPVIPAAIVAEADDSELELSRAEGLLARAIVRGNQAGVPVEPATAVAPSASEGLRSVASDKAATTLLLGWSRAPKFSRAIFGTVIEQVLDTSPELVIVARIPKSAKDISRVVLVLPPLIDRHPGYARGLSALSTFLTRSGSHLSIYVQKPGGQAARDASARLRARGQIQVTEIDTWKDVGASLRAMPTLQGSGAGSSNAAFAMFCVRPGGPAWHPVVEKLPHVLEDEFPGSPLLLFYLPELPVLASSVRAEEEKPAVRADLFEAAFDARRVIPAMKETAITDGIRELLKRSFGDNRKVLTRLASQLTEIAQKAPIELEPGVVLLHAHVPDVSEPIVFFGARPEGFRILALESPARVLVVLCSPEGLPPEAHLATLGEIARLFKDKALAERLLAAQSASELGRETESINDEELE